MGREEFTCESFPPPPPPPLLPPPSLGGGSAELPTTILDLRMVVQKTSLVGQIGVYVEGMCGVDIDLNPLGLTILP